MPSATTALIEESSDAAWRAAIAPISWPTTHTLVASTLEISRRYFTPARTSRRCAGRT